jgi:hypothetical protein
MTTELLLALLALILALMILVLGSFNVPSKEVKDEMLLKEGYGLAGIAAFVIGVTALVLFLLHLISR